MTTNVLTQAEAEQFLYAEADLLDDWKLREWLSLLTADVRYLVPAVGISDQMTADPDKVLFLIADNRQRVEQRVLRLLKDTAYAEYPHSRTRHLISNVRLRAADDDGADVTANFLVSRSKDSVVHTYVGKLRYALVRAAGQILIKEKRACLDLDSLTPQGKLSIIL